MLTFELVEYCCESKQHRLILRGLLGLGQIDQESVIAAPGNHGDPIEMLEDSRKDIFDAIARKMCNAAWTPNEQGREHREVGWRVHFGLTFSIKHNEQCLTKLIMCTLIKLDMEID